MTPQAHDHFFSSATTWNMRDAQNATSGDLLSSKAPYFTCSHFNLPVTTHKSTRPTPVEKPSFKNSPAYSTATGYCETDYNVYLSCWHFSLYSCLTYDLNAQTEIRRNMYWSLWSGLWDFTKCYLTSWTLAARLIISVNNLKTAFPRVLIGTILEGAHLLPGQFFIRVSWYFS